MRTKFLSAVILLSAALTALGYYLEWATMRSYGAVGRALLDCDPDEPISLEELASTSRKSEVMTFLVLEDFRRAGLTDHTGDDSVIGKWYPTPRLLEFVEKALSEV